MRKKVAAGISLWFLIAAVVAASGILASAKPPTLQIVVAGETLLLVLLYGVSRGFAEFACSIPLSRLTLFHLWRIVPGSGFLLLHHRGILPYAFAVPAGVGDIAVAVLAPIFAIVATRKDSGAKKAVLAFQLLGLFDLLMVVINAARTAFADPVSMRALVQAPLVMVPLFGVPLTLFIHVVAIHICLRRADISSGAAS